MRGSRAPGVPAMTASRACRAAASPAAPIFLRQATTTIFAARCEGSSWEGSALEGAGAFGPEPHGVGTTAVERRSIGTPPARTVRLRGSLSAEINCAAKFPAVYNAWEIVICTILGKKRTSIAESDRLRPLHAPPEVTSAMTRGHSFPAEPFKSDDGFRRA